MTGLTSLFYWFAIALVTGLWVAMPATAKDIKTVRLVQDSDYPPFMTATETGPAGIYADIIREADERLADFQIELTASPWPRALYLVAQGQANGLVGTYYKPNRRPWIRRFSTPLATETIFVYCREGVAKESWDYPDDYAGLLFSNNAGFATPGNKFFEMVDAGQIAVIEEQTTEQNLRLLQIGRADCYVQEKIAVETALRLNKFSAVRPIRQVLMEPAHIGYSEHWSVEDGDAFITQMDQILEEMAVDGTIQKIILKSIGGAF